MNKHYLKPFGLMITSQANHDFTQVMTPDEIRELVRKHRVVIFRGWTAIDKPAFVNFAATLGELLQWEFGYVMEMKAEVQPKNYLFTHDHVPFHWDGAFHQVPRFLLFHCIAAPVINAGGETLYADTTSLWQSASAAERKQWQACQLQITTEKIVHYGGEIIVPLVQKHIDTNETIIRFAEPVPSPMLNPVNVEIIQPENSNSENMLHDLSARCYDPRYCYEHTWQENDFLIADNYALIHARNAFKQFSPRHLRRIQVL